MYDRAAVTAIAAMLQPVLPGFDAKLFVRNVVRDLPPLTLMQRARRIADELHAALPGDYAKALKLLQKALDRIPLDGGDEGFSSFRYLPFVQFVGRYGLHDPDLSLAALASMTRWFSAEFDVRPYVLQHPKKTLAAARKWTRDPDWRVRRLASEGLRPRLPWGMRLQPFVADPSPIVPILDRLHDDPELSVRRSVANSLNDIAKDHPDLAAEIGARWWPSGVPSQRTVRHGLRSLIKQGHPASLALLGFQGGDAVRLSSMKLEDDRLTLGQTLSFTVQLQSNEAGPVALSIDYAVHHQKADGTLRPKVFKLTKKTLAPGETLTLTQRHKLVPITTRRYYAGEHMVELLVNGRSLGSRGFRLAI